MPSKSSSPIFSNIIWLLIDRTGKLLIAFITGIVIARILAPEIYGTLSLANALLGVISFLNLTATEAIVVMHLAREPESKDEILGCALAIRIIGSTINLLTIIILTQLRTEQPPIIATIAPILAIATLFNAFEVGEYWLRHLSASRSIVTSRQSILLIGASGRIWAALSDAPLFWLAFVTVFEAFAIGIALVFALYRLQAVPWKWKINWERSYRILNSALPLLIAAAAVGLYARIGLIILSKWHGTEAVSFFAIATFMTEATHALPIAILASITPELLRSQTADNFGQSRYFQLWLNRLTWMGLLVCLISYLAAPVIITTIFDQKYNSAIDTFRTLIWSAYFVYVSIISETWLIKKNLQRIVLLKTLIAATVSLVLNLALIPKYSQTGAALSSIAAYSIMALWGNLIFKESRPLFKLQIAAIFTIPTPPKKDK